MFRHAFATTLFSAGAAASGASAAPASSESAPPAATDPLLRAGRETKGSGPRRVAFLGDSLTYGYGLPRDATFPSLVARRVDAAGAHWRVDNHGVNGDTTSGGLARLEGILESRPDVMFVALGANDAMRHVPVAAIESNLRAIIERSRARGTRVVLAGMSFPPYFDAPYVNAFNAVFPRLSKEYGLAFVPFLLEGVFLHPELNLPDGVHPNTKGMEVIATTVWRTLGPLLAQTPASARPE